MDDPWFRQIAPLTWRPIRWQGYLWSLSMVAISVPFGLLFLYTVDTNPILGWGGGIAAVVSQFAGWAVVIWKTEDEYGR